MTKKTDEKWITAIEAAVILECEIENVRHMVRTGRIKARKPWLRARYDRASVMKLAKELNQFVPAKGASA
jgi:hypothetical protein